MGIDMCIDMCIAMRMHIVYDYLWTQIWTCGRAWPCTCACTYLNMPLHVPPRMSICMSHMRVRLCTHVPVHIYAHRAG